MHAHVCVHVHTCVCMCMCMYMCACVYTCVHLRVHVYVCVYMCQCVCVCCVYVGAGQGVSLIVSETHLYSPGFFFFFLANELVSLYVKTPLFHLQPGLLRISMSKLFCFSQGVPSWSLNTFERACIPGQHTGEGLDSSRSLVFFSLAGRDYLVPTLIITDIKSLYCFCFI